MKYIKYAIIILIIIIVVIMLLLLKNINNTNNNNINNINTNTNTYDGNYVDPLEDTNIEIPEDSDPEINLNIESKLSYVKNRSDYFSINNLYINYIDLLGNKDKEKLNQILSEEYKKAYNITDSNIFEKLVVPSLKNDTQYYKPIITEMLTAQIDNTTHIYIVKGKCRIVNMDNTILDIVAMFEIDTTNNTYIIYPYDYVENKGYDKLKVDETISYKKEAIKQNDTNTFKNITKSDSDVASAYLNNYKELLLHYPDEAYAKLNSNYSNKRFKNKEKFINYIADNRKIIASLSLESYRVNSYQDYTDYLCVDKYDNAYIFRQQDGIMQYTAFLDNYTILSNTEIQEYKQLDKLDRAKYNLNRFLNMINTKDYNAIYNVLDTTFKANNFKTVEELKKYIKNNTFDHNTIEIVEYNEETYEYTIFECSLLNSKDNNESKKITVIVNEAEGTDFTMSFTIE